MDYMTLKEAAEKWGVTPRRINYYCAPFTIIVAYLQSKSKTAKRSDPAVTR